jgi:hypothetical protein
VSDEGSEARDPGTALVPVSAAGHPPPFVSRFLLPLVKGGPLYVGRPLGRRALAAMIAAYRPGARRVLSIADMAEEDAIAELSRLRHARARALLLPASPPPLDESALRLGVAVHNLLALHHPSFEGRAQERRQAQIIDATLPIADLGPPGSAEEVVRRHSLVARLPEITRNEHTLDFWAGRRRFVGQPPPAHLLVFPRARRVTLTSQRRLWFKEIGVPSFGRALLLAIHRAAPLGEAMDPLRLDPPLAWERILPVLRFPPLCRLVAGRIVEVGLEVAGAALVAALLRFAAEREGVTPEAVAFAVRLLAHALWLDQLFGATALDGASELGVLLAAAHEVDRRLVWPPDVAVDSPLGAALRARFERLESDAQARAAERLAGLRTLCRFAASYSG